MRRELFSVFLFAICVATTAAATSQSQMVASFGGECEGTRFFSDRRAQLRGTFMAWFFYIHRRTTSWNALTAYIREGGDQGVIVTLRSRHGAYVQASERIEHGYYGSDQPFLKRMGVPKCS